MKKGFRIPAGTLLVPAQQPPDWDELMASLHAKRDERRRKRDKEKEDQE